MTRSDELHFRANEAHRKFDYFVTGFAIASLAYLVKELSPEKLGFNEFTFQIASLFLLGLACFHGIRHISMHHHLLHLNSKVVREGEHAGEMMKALQEKQDGYNQLTGEVITYDSLEERLRHHLGVRETVQKTLDQEVKDNLKLYKRRNVFLFLAVSVFFASKISAPYLPETGQSTPPSNSDVEQDAAPQIRPR